MTQSVDDRTKSKWRNLVDRLILATDLGAVTWQASVVDRQFLTNLNDKIITLGHAQENGRDLYFFRIDEDFSNTKIDYFDDEDLDNSQGGYSQSNGHYFAVLKDFHNLLSRKVSGADSVLDELLDQLPELPSEEKERNMGDEIPF